MGLMSFLLFVAEMFDWFTALTVALQKAQLDENTGVILSIF